ncbi:MAG: universal stress protein UspA related nucleotide-binding protein [Haloquadratum walsbyi J07HQW2]|uniref:Universal stress protein UspA related nucleotide-binding protein n=2 Tax=Haloquadratum walsbyi TaxID=293091 RepID=U1PSP1_9EURY|nr:universal stress protein [Haloquadratum walsbyi]ERG96822.1 MAG: universal stress protein UspA related nucleotide-binding protein [Haloquadratum walsbyi J07HQW2]
MIESKMYDTILIPYDGSDEAKKGATNGIELAAAVDAQVHALYVIDLPGVPRALSIRDNEEEVRKEYGEYAEKVLEEACELAAAHDVTCQEVTRTGSPSEEITDYAEMADIDVIAMGSAYRGKVGSLIGGTAEKVFRSSTTPVITHRMSADNI